LRVNNFVCNTSMLYLFSIYLVFTQMYTRVKLFFLLFSEKNVIINDLLLATNQCMLLNVHYNIVINFFFNAFQLQNDDYTAP